MIACSLYRELHYHQKLLSEILLFIRCIMAVTASCLLRLPAPVLPEVFSFSTNMLYKLSNVTESGVSPKSRYFAYADLKKLSSKPDRMSSIEVRPTALSRYHDNTRS